MTSLKRYPVMKNKAPEGSAVDKFTHISTQDMAVLKIRPTTFEEDLAHAKWMHNLFRAAIEKDKKKYYIGLLLPLWGCIFRICNSPSA